MTIPKWYTVFEDNSGGFSMVRLCLLLIVLTFLWNWSFVIYHKKDFVVPPENVVQLIIGFGAVKAVQRFGEKSENNSSTPPPTV